MKNPASETARDFLFYDLQLRFFVAANLRFFTAATCAAKVF